MIRGVVLFCIMAFSITAAGVPFSEEMAVMECKAHFKVPQSDFELIKNRKLPVSKDGKCMMACIMKKMKIMNKRGQFDLKAVKRWLASKYKRDMDKLSKANMIADECAKDLIPTVGTDQCDMAVRIMQCTKKKGHLATKSALRTTAES